MRRSDYPSIDESDKRMLFSERQYLRMFGKLVVLLSLAGVALAVSLSDVPSPVYLGILIVASVLAILGGFAATWTQTLLLDFESSVCISTRGPQFLAKAKVTSLVEVDYVLLCREAPADSAALDNARYSLSIVFPDKQISIFGRRIDENPDQLANTIADQLDKPLRVTELYREAREAPKNPTWASGVMWTAMLTVAGIMLWPVISGSRPLISQSGSGRRGLFTISDASSVGYDQGVRQYQVGDYVQAEKTLRAAQKESPHDAEIVNMLAYSLAEQGRLDEALETANRALKLAPISGNIIDTVAEMHERRKEFVPAADLYAKALQHMAVEDTGETNTKFGRTLIALDRNSEAKQHLLDAIKYPSFRWDPLARRLLKELYPNIKLPKTKSLPMPSPMMNMRGGPRMMPMAIRP
jgi:tetratricopeptide (TPR) repeat protein